MLKINCLELLEGHKYLQQEKKTPVLSDNSLFHAVFRCTKHVYCENIT